MASSVPPFKRLYDNISIRQETSCWEWLGQTGSSGYGQIKCFGRMVSTHRLSYELYFGHIPKGLEILHSCDNKLCINPDHLSANTHAKNMSDAAKRNRLPRGERHPMYGKPVERPRQSNKVKVLGKIFKSQRAAEKFFGLGKGTVLYWIKNNPEKASIIEKGELNVIT